MKSIQTRLTATLLLTTIGIICASAAALCVFLQYGFNRQLDRAIESQSLLLTSAMEIRLDGKIKFDAIPEFGAFHKSIRPIDFFEIWTSSGQVLFRSASLAGAELPFHPVEGDSLIADLPLPNGRTARTRTTRFQPRIDDDVLNSIKASGGALPVPKAREVILAVAHDRGEIDEELHVFLIALLVTAAAIAISITFAASWAVRHALEPLRQIGRDADRIDASQLNHRFAIDDELPAELAPICTRLNDLLSRLHNSFERERRFTANAAHELRTPIAELRAMTEVALRWPPGPAAVERNLHDSLQIAQQMASIVSALLSLARCESGSQSIDLAPVRVGELLSAAWKPHQREADQRQLTLAWEGAGDGTRDGAGKGTFDALVLTDRDLFFQIFSNLFSNASRYAKPDTCISCSVHLDHTGATITIANKTDALSESDLPSLFEPFWRKDAARSGQDHSGLGLSITAAFAKLLGHTIDATLDDGVFAITVHVASTTVAEALNPPPNPPPNSRSGSSRFRSSVPALATSDV